MEESQNTENRTQDIPQENPVAPAGVSFPTVGQPQKSNGAKTLLIVGVLILVGILGFVIYKSAAKKNDETLTEPTPSDNSVTPSDNQIAATPVATVAPITTDKTKITIQVQNGTGITGEASYLQTQLKSLGYTTVSVGNSASQNLTATNVSFGSTVPASVVNELTTELGTLYQSVTTTTAGSTTYDVVIITGLRKGATAKPVVTAAPSASPIASPIPTSTPTPTSTP